MPGTLLYVNQSSLLLLMLAAVSGGGGFARFRPILLFLAFPCVCSGEISGEKEKKKRKTHSVTGWQG